MSLLFESLLRSNFVSVLVEVSLVRGMLEAIVVVIAGDYALRIAPGERALRKKSCAGVRGIELVVLLVVRCLHILRSQNCRD